MINENLGEKVAKALVQNCGFKKAKYEKLPTIDFAYPDYTTDGTTEAFRFDAGLRNELRDRATIVRDKLKDKTIIYTLDQPTLYEVEKIAPRLGMEEDRTKNTLCPYAPLLFTGLDNEEFEAFVVKPLITNQMNWF